MARLLTLSGMLLLAIATSTYAASTRTMHQVDFPIGDPVPDPIGGTPPVPDPVADPVPVRDCGTLPRSSWWECCESGRFDNDPTCPPAMCNDLDNEADSGAYCIYKAKMKKFDPTCPFGDSLDDLTGGTPPVPDPVPDPVPVRDCGTLPRSSWWECCEGRRFDNDPTCPPAMCNDLDNEADSGACCIYKAKMKKFDPTCPFGDSLDDLTGGTPPVPDPVPDPVPVRDCGTLPRSSWWECCESRRFDNDPTCPPTSCGDLNNTADVRDCCAYKGVWTDDQSCPLVTCYGLKAQLRTTADVYISTFGNILQSLGIDPTGNVTEAVEVATQGFNAIAKLFGGQLDDFNSSIVYTNRPIPTATRSMEMKPEEFEAILVEAGF